VLQSEMKPSMVPGGSRQECTMQLLRLGKLSILPLPLYQCPHNHPPQQPKPSIPQGPLTGPAEGVQVAGALLPVCPPQALQGQRLGHHLTCPTHAAAGVQAQDDGALLRRGAHLGGGGGERWEGERVGRWVGVGVGVGGKVCGRRVRGLKIRVHCVEV
jgi:hypothetical protein